MSREFHTHRVVIAVEVTRDANILHTAAESNGRDSRKIEGRAFAVII